MVRSQKSLDWLTDEDFNTDDLVLDYLKCAHDLSEAAKQLTQDLVAESRSRGKTWAEIGGSLRGMKPTAAQKRFGADLDLGRVMRMAEENMAIGLSHISADPPGDSEDFSDEWEGTDHIDRLRYALNILVDTRELLARAVEGDPQAIPFDEFQTLIIKSHQKMGLLFRTLLLDPEIWQTICTWHPSSMSQDSIAYGSPAVYLHYVMMHSILISMQISRAHREDEPHALPPIARYRNALTLIESALYILFRKDVQLLLFDLKARNGK
jgi:hypothetical protein